jgi:signal transduction histidine kinase
MRIRSVRWRITALAVVISTVVLGACAIAVVLVMRAELIDNIDGSLSQQADEVEAAVAADPARPLANRDPEDRFAQVLDVEGDVLIATDNVAGLPAIVGLPDGSRALVTHTEPTVDEDPLRVMIRRSDAGGEVQYVVVGESVDDINEAVRSLVLALLVTIPIAVAVLGAMVWWLVGRTLEPVSRIRREVDAIGLGELDRRVPSPGTGDEIDELATTMNAMLARLEESAGRQRRFVSDASHELRTPLARVRSTIEVELAQPDDQRSESSLESTCRSALGEVVAMQDLVDDLLLVARSDTVGAPRESRLVDLDVIVEEEVRQLRSTSNVRIDMARVSAATVTGDASQLSRVVRNVLTNAVRHAAGRVELTLAEREVVELLVDDDGPGIPIGDRQRVFERFVRLDEARTQSDGGTGLGLAIAHDIVVAHGGAIAISDAPIGGARIVVTLPAAGPPRAKQQPADADEPRSQTVV